MKMLKVKSIVIETKKVLDGVISRLDATQGGISKWEDQ